MTRLEAHGRFLLMKDRSFLSDGNELGAHFAAVATALVDHSGWLEDCADDDDLRAAAEQGEALYASGVVEGSAIADTANDVIREVMEWCEQQGETPCSEDS